MNLETGGLMDRAQDLRITEIEKQAFWEHQNDAYRKLSQLENRGADRVFGIESLKESVAVLPTALVCDDERVAINDDKVVEVAIAGSGVLMDDNQRLSSIEKMRRAGINLEQLQVTCHDGCGACAVWKSRNPSDGRTLQEIEEDAATKFRTLAKATKPIARIGFDLDQTSKLAMDGHSSFHHARAIVLDGTGRINLGKLALPSSFLISARYSADNDCLKQELEIIASIPLGDHGFNTRFAEEAPLNIVIVGDPYGSEGLTANHLESIANQVVAKWPNHTKIVSFTAPKYTRSAAL